MAKEIEALNARLDSIRGEYADVIAEKDMAIDSLKVKAESMTKAPEVATEVGHAEKIKSLEKELVSTVYFTEPRVYTLQ